MGQFRCALVLWLLWAACPCFSTEVPPGCPPRLVPRADRIVTVAGHRVRLESTAEIELPLEQLVLGMTTEDGTVGPALRGFAPTPWFLERYPAGAATPWKRVRKADRVRLIDETHRAAHGWDELEGVEVERAAWPGSLTHWLQPEIETVLAGSDPSWVEVRWRGPFRPSKVRQLMDRLFPKAPSLHIHTPVPLDLLALRRRPQLESALHIDLVLRANLLAEMLSILYRGSPIRTTMMKGAAGSSGTLGEDQIPHIVRFFEDISEGRIPKLRQETKIAFVGIRDDATYDHENIVRESPRVEVYLIGLEHRFLRRGKAGVYGDFPPEALPLLDAFLDRSRDILAYRDFGAHGVQVADWLRHRPWNTGSETRLEWAFDLAWHNQIPGRDTAYVSKEATAGLSARRWKLIESIYEDEPEHEEVAMLVHDWSHTPLVYGNAALQRRIVAGQRKALTELTRRNVNAVVQRFLWETGLFHATVHSFGLSRKLIPEPPPSAR